MAERSLGRAPLLAGGLAAALALLAAAPAAASPLHLFGFGGRSPAMGATGVATACDFDCVYLNPAGLADVRRKRFSAGTLLGRLDLEGPARPVEPALGVEIGGALPLRLGGPLKDRVGLGLGFYAPGGLITRARAPAAGTPYYVLLESGAQIVGIQVGLGVRATPRLAVGASFLALAALRGHIDIAPAGQGFRSTSEQQIVAHYAPIVGAQLDLGRRGRAGATLRFPSRASYDILVTNRLDEALPVTLPELRFAGVINYDPLTLAVEHAHAPAAGWTVTTQLAYERWSAFPRPTENPVRGKPPTPAPQFHDTVVPRLGVEWRTARGALDLALRGGGAFVTSPAPAGRGDRALLDNHRAVVGAGLGLGTGRTAYPVQLDLWVQLHALVPREHDLASGPLTTRGTIAAGGLVVGVDL